MGDSLHEGHRARLRAAAENDPELASFSDYQTLEFLLSYLIPRKDTNPIAHELINRFGSLYAVFHANNDELYDVPNMTANAASFLTHFYSIFRKSEISRNLPKPVLSTVKDAAEFLRPYFLGRNEEFVYCVALNLNDRVLQVIKLTEGLSDVSTVNNSKILSIVTRTKAKKIILAHNHPAGSLRPSQADVNASQSLFMLLASANAVLSDHIIFSDNRYYSLYENHTFDPCVKSMDKILGIGMYEEMRAKDALNHYLLEPKSENE